MSERSSMMSEWMYCSTCRDVLHEVFDAEIDVSQSGRGIARFSQIVVGYIGGSYGGESAFEVEQALEVAAPRLCHPVFVVVIDEALGPVCFSVEDGEVEQRNAWSRDEMRARVRRGLTRAAPPR